MNLRDLPSDTREMLENIIKVMVEGASQGISSEAKDEFVKSCLDELDAEFHDELETSMTLLITSLARSMSPSEVLCIGKIEFSRVISLFDLAWRAGRQYQRTQEFKIVKRKENPRS